MKKIFLIVTTISVFSACKSKTATTLDANRNMVLVDTSGLSKSNASTDVGATVNGANPQATSTNRNTGNTGNTRANRSTNNNSGGSTARSGGSGNSGSSSQGSTVPARERGWSDAAKGTAIGAGSGAVLGAIVSKNKAKGAVIGGVIGGAGGYAIGRSKDRKSGRVTRQKQRRAAGY